MKKAEMWERHIHRRKELGLTRKAYCEREGLSLHSLSYWTSKLNGSREALVARHADSSGKFVQVQKIPETTSGTVELMYPSGVRLRCSVFPPPSWVRQVV